MPSYQGICHLCREEKLAMQYSRKISQKRRQTIVDQDAIKAALGKISGNDIIKLRRYRRIISRPQEFCCYS